MTTSVGEARTGWVADDSTFGARLALVRQRMQWGNVKEAADACSIPVESWRRWERDGRAPRDVVDQAGKISARTGCDLGWLIDPRLLRRALVASGEGPTMRYPASRERTKRSRMRTPVATLMGHPGHRPADLEPTLPVATLTSCPTPTITRPAIVPRRKSA